MTRNVVSSAIALLVSVCAGAGCSGSQEAPAVPAPSASADAPPAGDSSATASASAAPDAPSAAPSAAPAADAPSDPMLSGLTGDDLDWAKNCLGGDGSYCTKFGNQKEFVSKDFPGALAWYQKGCDAKKKEPICCMGVARLTIAGQGTAANVDAGVKIWADACATPNRDSCSELAKAYEAGTSGLKKDAKKAKEFYGKACDLKDVSACKKAGKKPPKD